MKIKEIKHEIILSIDYKDVIEYLGALEGMLCTFEDQLGKIGENGNSLRKLLMEFRKINKRVQTPYDES